MSNKDETIFVSTYVIIWKAPNFICEMLSMRR